MINQTSRVSRRSGRSTGASWLLARPATWSTRVVQLATGRRMLVHEVAGPPGAATLVLLHGWRGTALGNWSTAMTTLAREFHVIAPDLRRHDSEAVEDVVALADALSVDRFIAVGYSLGSAVAAQLRYRYPGRVEGLVLCAPAGVPASSRSVGTGGSTAPTAVVVTRRDRLVPPWRQLELARSIAGATVHAVNGNHFAFSRYETFVPALLEACHSVDDRARGRGIAVEF